jgi:hypothetical protein
MHAQEAPSGAEIIAFPVRAPSAEDRLSRALKALDAALAEQRESVAAWRRALAELGAGTDRLGASLGGLQDRLATLHKDVDAVNAAARRLERWAEGVGSP